MSPDSSSPTHGVRRIRRALRDAWTVALVACALVACRGSNAERTPAATVPTPAPDPAAPAVERPPAARPTAVVHGDPAQPGNAPPGSSTDVNPSDSVPITPRAPAAAGSGELPEHGCTTVGARRTIFATAAAPSVIGLDAGYAVVAYVPSGAGVSAAVLVTTADGRTTRVLTRFPVSPSIHTTQLVPPAVMRVDANHLGVATVDGLRRIDYREIDPATGTSSEPIRVANGDVDIRFPPALASIGGVRLLAYTKTGDPQRVEVVVLDRTPRVIGHHDVTPDSSGAASPTFVRDVTPPFLVFVDPREALSLSHAVSFDRTGAPSADDGLQPIIGLVTPARIVAALGPHDLELAFLAHGGDSNHMGAFVLGSHSNSITPRSLVPASDFARLWVDALGTSYGALTVSLAPHDGEANAAREAVVRVVDSAGLGPELRLVATRGSAVYPMLARDDAGRLGVLFGTEAGLELVPIACRGTAD